ncbi:unnamed protein product, partial [Oppiella nova]
MALNYIKCVKNQNSLHLMRSLCPLVTKKSFLSTDSKSPKVVSNETQVFDQKIERQIKDHVLDKPTHTGQTFTADDYRLVRFVGKTKEINPRFAIDLIAETPPIASKERWISCDGGGGALGHPKV